MIRLNRGRLKDKTEELYEYLKNKDLLLISIATGKFYTILEIEDDAGIEGLIDYMWEKGLGEKIGFDDYGEYKASIKDGEINIRLPKHSIEVLDKGELNAWIKSGTNSICKKG